MKKKPPFNSNAAIRSAIRRVFSRSPIVREVMNDATRRVPRYNKDGSRAKVDAVERLCRVCDTWTPAKFISVDHRIPVISVEEGFIDWNTFVERIGFEKKENLQCICDTCHDAKTYLERCTRQIKVDMMELDAIERMLNSPSTMTKEHMRLLKRELTKYIAKKKSPGLKPISERAATLRVRLENRMNGIKRSDVQ